MKVLKFLGHFYREVLVIFGLLVLFNNYLHPKEEHILADGIGYYDYLPSIFIHHDFVRKNFPKDTSTEKYERILLLKTSYSHVDNYVVNKYGIGTALLNLPTFLFAKWNVDSENVSGYEKAFHVASYHASIFYLFLGLVLFRKFCRTYSLNEPATFISQILLIFSTPILYYTSDMTAYSHVYSFFAITGFLLFTRKQINGPSFSNFMMLIFFLGLIFLIRSINVLIVLAIRFLSGSRTQLTSFAKSILSKPKELVIATLTLMLIMSSQSLVWYLQSGLWFVDSYPHEQFYFGNPQIFNILFSFRKGLFTYTPVLLFSILGSLILLRKGEVFSWFSWIVFFLVLTYIFSSWWSWSYNECYGSRVYIDFLSILIFPLTLYLSYGHILLRVLVIGLCLVTIPVNAIQVFQFKNFILKWDHMNESDYKKVFLNQDNRLKAYLWKKEISLQSHEIALDTILPDLRIEEKESFQLISIETSKIPDWDKIVGIRIEFENDFSFERNGALKLCIGNLDHSKCDFFRFVDMIHLANGPFGKYHKGNFNFVLNRSEVLSSELVKIDFEQYTGNAILKHPRLIFLKEKKK